MHRTRIWKLYRYKFVALYLVLACLETASAHDATSKVFNNGQFHFEGSYPSDWSEQTCEGKECALKLKKSCSETDKSCRPKIITLFIHQNSDIAPQTFMKNERYHSIETLPFGIAGNPVYYSKTRADAELIDGEEIASQGSQIFAFRNDKYLYELVATTELKMGDFIEFDQELAEIGKRILRTLRFSKQKRLPTTPSDRNP